MYVNAIATPSKAKKVSCPKNPRGYIQVPLLAIPPSDLATSTKFDNSAIQDLMQACQCHDYKQIRKYIATFITASVF
jgi:hypothetical protein